MALFEELGLPACRIVEGGCTWCWRPVGRGSQWTRCLVRKRAQIGTTRLRPMAGLRHLDHHTPRTRGFHRYVPVTWQCTSHVTISLAHLLTLTLARVLTASTMYSARSLFEWLFTMLLLYRSCWRAESSMIINTMEGALTELIKLRSQPVRAITRLHP
jgi:hypothetical protein